MWNWTVNRAFLIRIELQHVSLLRVPRKFSRLFFMNGHRLRNRIFFACCLVVDPSLFLLFVRGRRRRRGEIRTQFFHIDRRCKLFPFFFWHNGQRIQRPPTAKLRRRRLEGVAKRKLLPARERERERDKQKIPRDYTAIRLCLFLKKKKVCFSILSFFLLV